MIALCDANLADPQLGVTGMAEVAGLTRPPFTRLSTAAIGISPARYLMRLRMEAAVRLLQPGAASVKEVSLGCGFSDANYFAKAFRRIYGQSPRDLRPATWRRLDRRLAFSRVKGIVVAQSGTGRAIAQEQMWLGSTWFLKDRSFAISADQTASWHHSQIG